MKTLTLDFKTWRSGLSGINATGEGETYLLNEEGFMCCLGQFALQCDFNKEEILSFNRPMELEKEWPLFSEISDISFCGFKNTELAKCLIDINDNNYTTYQQKIELIRAELAKHNIELNVINLP